MEKLYTPEHLKASEQLDLKKYFEEYGKLYTMTQKKIKGQNIDANTALIMQEIGLPMTLEDVRSLETVCSIDKLRLSTEPDELPLKIPDNLGKVTKLDTYYPINTEARTLETVKCKEVMDKKFEFMDFISKGKRGPIPKHSEANLLCGNMSVASNYILKIFIYRPYSVFVGQRNSSENLRFKYEIEALGTNTLLQIANNIVCICDKAVIKEVANTKQDLSHFMNAKDKYPSRTFFINDVFYNDLSNPKAIDYSEKIIQWAKEKNIGNFNTDTMNIKLNKLKLRLGYPYVYIHQGNCEHILTFSDARLIQGTDCLNSNLYPRTTDTKREFCILCCICSATNANWIVSGSDRFLQEKAFVCTECCNSYMYLDGDKIGEFKLFPYYDTELLTRHLEDDDSDPDNL